jgi:hypothetical protein
MDAMLVPILRGPRLLVLALIFAGYPAPQTAPAPEGLTLAKLESAIKTYFRDSAEFPLHMETALVATDASGRVRQRKTGKADYDFHGYNPRSRNAAGHLYGSSSTMGAARNVMLATMLPFTVFDVDAAEHSPLKVSDSDAAGRLLTATIPQLPECAEFQWSAKHSAPGLICGASEFQLQKDDLELQRFSFDAGATTLKKNSKRLFSLAIPNPSWSPSASRSRLIRTKERLWRAAYSLSGNNRRAGYNCASACRSRPILTPCWRS